MKLLEYQGKELFRRYDIPVTKGIVVSTLDALEHKVADLNFPVAVKVQIPTGGRGKAGGIKIVDNIYALKETVREFLGSTIKNYRVGEVLIEEAKTPVKELYLGFIIDRDAKMPLLIASSEGGVDIESAPEEKIYRTHINPFVGLMPYMIRSIISKMGLSSEEARVVSKISHALYNLFVNEDCEMAEINPILVASDGTIYAADARIEVDDEALFRHPGMERINTELTPLEKKAREKGITFVQLDGTIGVIANGAGLTMSTIDTLELRGLKTKVFLDLGGTDDENKVYDALELMAEAMPEAIFINMLGGITKGDTVARALKRAIEDFNMTMPIVARIKGVALQNPEEILRNTHVILAETSEEGADIIAEKLGVK